jgi:ATP-dependent DNA ligase
MIVKDRQFEFPTLYDSGRLWSILLKVDEFGRGYLWTKYGKIDGKIITSTPREITYKSELSQDSMYKKIYKLAETKWKNKQILGFKTDVGNINHHKNISKDSHKTILPMTAYNYRKYSHKITFPAYVQVKYDGYRAILDLNTAKFISRRGKSFINLKHLIKEIGQLNMNMNKSSGLYLDGELVLRSGLHNLKKAISKSNNNNNKELIEYYVFDLLDTNKMDLSFHDRFNRLKTIFQNHHFKYIKLAETHLVKSDKDILSYLSKFLKEGHEGLIVRNINGIYKLGSKSMNVQKLIETKLGKFKIVGFKEGTKKQVIWQLKCQKSDDTFWAIPIGDNEFRQKLLKDAKEYIGKLVDVKYFEIDSEGCVTRNPIVLMKN